MVDVVAYHNPVANPAWIAYIVLPNSNDYWGVRFEGATESIAKDKAIRLWESERAKYAKQDAAVVEPIKSSGRGHHFAGKVWVVNRATHDLKRINQDELAVYEAQGYVRGGPRSK